MADFKVGRVEQAHTKIRNVPIAVTPEGFWCCPSPAVFQKTLKNQTPQTKQRHPSSPLPSKSPIQKCQQNPTSERKSPAPTPPRSTNGPNEQRCPAPETAISGPTERQPKPVVENVQRKISVGFGDLETSDLKVVLSGKEGFSVRMSVHKNILAEHGSFFAEKLSTQSPSPFLEIRDCEDMEIYVETIGLMYCKEMKLRLIKQSVPRVLRVLKVAELLGFHACMKSCLEYLEAVPWVGEEEENVVSSVLRLRSDGLGVSPVLKRVSSEVSNPPNDTLAHIMDLVLKSNEERGRREMKTLVLKLLRENSLLVNGSGDICIKSLYNSCRSCLDSLLCQFRQAAEPDSDKSLENTTPVARQISLEADNLLWLLEILADRQVADEFVVMWAGQQELAMLHLKLPIVSRHLVSCITARIFVGIGRGEMLPSKDTRQLLLNVWLQPLIDDYSWLQHGCRSFDRKVVEEGIGRTILTLPLEEQQSILLSWLGSFLKAGHNCPNLQRAFEVWWRRTFIRPYVEQHQGILQSDNTPMTPR
ncbi:BTB/POZ domain-containing protein [Acorus calamus]|uniref:BTB/POZ domain-containing protein n=1 Tax=Acorus calamus TaxID=4465 RepID=A0AAV9DKH1_ACOCL|nr:BTB/POZ domain-containing protein [Acorus calamus]